MSHSYKISLGKPTIGKRYVGLMVLSSTLLGCSHLSPEPSSGVTVPAQFSEQGSHQSEHPWWEELNDPQLSMLINQALEDNFTLRAANERLSSYVAQQQSISAKRYPTLNSHAELGHDRGVFDRSGIQRSNTQHAIDARLSWELDFWGKNRFSAESLHYTVLEHHERLAAMRLIVSGEITQNWLDYVEQVQQANNVKQQIDTAQQLQKMVEQRFASGTGALTAVLRQQQLIESLQATLNQIESHIVLKRQSLNVLLGQTPLHPLPIDRVSIPQIGPLPALGVPAQWLEQRVDLKERWYRYQSKRYQAASLGAARLPSLTIGANASADAESWLGEFDLWRLDLGVKLDVPLFDAGKRLAEHQRAQALEREAYYLYTNQVLQALNEVESALIDERNQRVQWRSINKQTEMANQVLQLELTRYQHGTTSFLSVLEAQEKWLQLQRRGLTQQISVAKRRVKLHLAIGSGITLSQHHEAEMASLPSNSLSRTAKEPAA